MPNDTPNFPPISVLPMLLSAVIGSLESSEEQLENFRRAKNRPYSLDDKTVHDVIRSYTKQSETIAQEKAMCAYWRSQGNLNTLQKKMLKDLEEKLLRMEEVNLLIINLANHCKLKTIEKIIHQNDAELAITTLQEWLSAADEDEVEDPEYDDDNDEEGEESDDLDDSEIECPVCGETIARLIYVDDINNLQELEDCAANLLPTLKHQTLPTWIIAEDPSDSDDEPWEEKSFIMQVFPTSTPAERVSSELFDEELDQLAESHCDNENREEDEDESSEDNPRSTPEKLTKLNNIITSALLELRALTELETSSPQELFSFVKTFLLGVISTSIDLVEMQQPGISTALYSEVEAIAKMGGLRAIADFQNTYSERTYSVSQIADDDMETAMNYVGQELGTTLIKSINELPMPLRQPETFLRGIEALLGNLLNQKFNNPHDILDSLCDHVHMALDSLHQRKH